MLSETLAPVGFGVKISSLYIRDLFRIQFHFLFVEIFRSRYIVFFAVFEKGEKLMYFKFAPLMVDTLPV